MRKRVGFALSGIAAATLLLLPPPAGADPTSAPCPDGFLPFVAVTLEEQKKDRNANGLVCRKVEDGGKVVGGPDDRVTDDVLV